MKVEYIKLHSNQINDYINDIANLRIKVFSEYPYLYQGDIHYERKYLLRYTKAQSSLIIMAVVDKKLVGLTTCLAMIEEEDEFQAPLRDNGFDIEKGFYFGESIILSEYRGNGVGHRFFEQRENHAKKVIPNLSFTCFCAVERDESKLRPNNYKPLNHFWNKMGYEFSGIKTRYSWKDIGDSIETVKEMDYWIKNWKK
ncbi:MAG: GNAT family N-acetyltransferase [Halobacteriovoraceae bacterium]|nr:GNAT family N-acetyltransferase [Halobacteriovoraceae bacterium]